MLHLRLLKGAHRLYKLCLSPLFGNACRFEPYCSDYFVQAIELHGVWRGSALGFWRLLRCNPFCEGGIDPVPEVLSRGRAHELKDVVCERDTTNL